MMGVMKLPAPEIADAAQAAAGAKKLLDAGVDGIKIFASAPRSAPLSESVFQAAANEAHRAGKPVFVHPNNATDVLSAVRGGVDIVAHTTPHSGPWDETLLAAMKEHRVALTPTLTLWKYYARHDRLSAQEKVTDTEIGQLRAWLAAEGTVLFGSDLGAVEYDPTEEYALMSEAGMTFPQILASLTTNPAERFGDANKRGRIAAGLQADLAAFHQDPAIDLRALAHAKYTLRAGKIIYRAAE
jgi:imidazolonepropionase-like amidohydrolase